MQPINDGKYKPIESEENDSGDSWKTELLHQAFVLEVQAGDVENIKALLASRKNVRICHTRVSKAYLFIVSQRPAQVQEG